MLFQYITQEIHIVLDMSLVRVVVFQAGEALRQRIQLGSIPRLIFRSPTMAKR